MSEIDNQELNEMDQKANQAIAGWIVGNTVFNIATVGIGPLAIGYKSMGIQLAAIYKVTVAEETIQRITESMIKKIVQYREIENPVPIFSKIAAHLSLVLLWNPPQITVAIGEGFKTYFKGILQGNNFSEEQIATIPARMLAR